MHSTLPKLATLFGLTLLIIGCGEPENIKTHTETKTFPAKGVLSGTDVEVYFGHFLLEWRADYSDQNKNDIMDEGEIINGTYTLVFYAPVEITWMDTWNTKRQLRVKFTQALQTAHLSNPIWMTRELWQQAQRDYQAQAF